MKMIGMNQTILIMNKRRNGGMNFVVVRLREERKNTFDTKHTPMTYPWY